MAIELLQVDDLDTATLDDTDTIIVGEDSLFKQATLSSLKEAIIGSEAETTTESVPYLTRTTANAGVINKIALEKVVGGSIAWNQLIQNGDFAATTGWTTSSQWSFSDNKATINVTTTSATFYNLYQTLTTIVDHKYLCACTVSGLSGTSVMSRFAFSTSWGNYPTSFKEISGDGRYEGIGNATATTTYVGIKNQVTNTTFTESISNFICVDLTQMFGSAIADYIYNLESDTAGAGVAKLQEWGFFTDSYYEYNSGELMHVEATSHVTRDADNNVLGTYPLDSSLVLRGIPKLDSSNNLYYDGDTYEPSGTVTRKCGIRAYTSGDATDGSTMITDGTNTVYALTTETTESADPYQRIQSVSAGGTEAFTTTSIVPVGHETRTPDNVFGALTLLAE